MIAFLGSLLLAAKPNIMLIVADDQGYANIGYHNSTVLTPRIDAIANEGVSERMHRRGSSSRSSVDPYLLEREEPQTTPQSVVRYSALQLPCIHTGIDCFCFFNSYCRSFWKRIMSSQSAVQHGLR